MQAKITRNLSKIDEKLQVEAQGTLYENVTLFHPQGLLSLPDIKQKAWLMFPNKICSYGNFALPIIDDKKFQDQKFVPLKLGATHLVANSGAQIILQADGNILLKPASGKNIYRETPAGKKRILADGDPVTISGNGPANGMISLNSPET